MNISKAEQRQIENEMIFRRINEKVGSDIDDIDAMHIEDGNSHLLYNDNIEIQFKCECSDESCDERIPLRLEEYQHIHINRSTFIVKTDHEVDAIEQVTQREEGYNVVKKDNTTPEPNDTLKITTIDNSPSASA